MSATFSSCFPSFAGFAALVLYALGRSFAREQSVGVAELVGAQGRTATNLTPDGKVFVRGEYWTASAEEEIPSGESVEITAVEGLRLRVHRAAGDRHGRSIPGGHHPG